MLRQQRTAERPLLGLHQEIIAWLFGAAATSLYRVHPCMRVSRIKLFLDAADLLFGLGLSHAPMMATGG